MLITLLFPVPAGLLQDVAVGALPLLLQHRLPSELSSIVVINVVINVVVVGTAAEPVAFVVTLHDAFKPFSAFSALLLGRSQPRMGL